MLYFPLALFDAWWLAIGRVVVARKPITTNQHDSQTEQIESKRSRFESNGSIRTNRTTLLLASRRYFLDFPPDLASWSRFGVAKSKRGPTGGKSFGHFCTLKSKNSRNSASGGNALSNQELSVFVVLFCRCTLSNESKQAVGSLILLWDYLHRYRIGSSALHDFDVCLLTPDPAVDCCWLLFTLISGTLEYYGSTEQPISIVKMNTFFQLVALLTLPTSGQFSHYLQSPLEARPR